MNDHPVGTFVDSSSTAASSKVKKSFGDDWLPNGSCLSDLLQLDCYGTYRENYHSGEYSHLSLPAAL